MLVGRVVVTSLLMLSLDAYAFEKVDTDAEWLSYEELRGVIDDAAAREGLHPALIRAVIKAGSYYNARKIADDGRLGLMLIDPSQLSSPHLAFDPALNVQTGAKRLRRLIEELGSARRALIAYGGPGPNGRRFVRNALRNYRDLRVVYMNVR